MIIGKGYYISCFIFAIFMLVLSITFFICAFVTKSYLIFLILCIACWALASYNVYCAKSVPSSSLKGIAQFIQSEGFIVTHEFDFFHQSILIDDENHQIIFARIDMRKPPLRCVKYSDLLSNKLTKIKTKKDTRYELHCVLKNCDYEEIIFNMGNSKVYADMIIPFLDDCRKYKPPKTDNFNKNISKESNKEIMSDLVASKKEEDWNWLEY